MIRAQKHQKMAYSNSISIASNSAKKSLSSKKKVSSISFHPIQNFFERLAENEKRVPSACCKRNDNNGLQKKTFCNSKMVCTWHHDTSSIFTSFAKFKLLKRQKIWYEKQERKVINDIWDYNLPKSEIFFI